MATTRQAGSYGGIATVMTVAFLATIAILTLLGEFGLPEGVLSTVLGGAVLLTFIAIGISSATMQTSTFYLAGRALPTPANGAATAAAAFSAALYLGLAGNYLADFAAATAITLGWCFGFLITAVGIAPYLRKSSAFGVADFLGIRYGSRLVRLAAVIVVAITMTLAVAAALLLAATVASSLFGLDNGTALVIAAALVLLPVVLGGAGATSRVAVAQYIVLAIAFLAPMAVIAAREYGLPIPQLDFGMAVRDAGLLVLAAGRDLVALPGHYSWPGADGAMSVLTTVVAVAAGVAVLPHLAFRSATVPGASRARFSAGWALFFILIVALAAPAYAAFTRLIILREVADIAIVNLPDWVFSYGRAGFVQVCGQDATSVATLTAACELAGVGSHVPASSIAISADGLVLAAPAILDLPYVFSALVLTGAIAAALAVANAATFAAASALGHDFYGGVIGRRVSGGRQLIVTRLVAVAIVAVSAWLASGDGSDVFALAPAVLSLSAAGLLPAALIGVWWRRANVPGALAGIVLGTIVTGAIVLAGLYPSLAFLDPLGLAGIFNALTAGAAGVVIGAVALVAVSLATPAPSEEAQTVTEAIRRPGGTPMVQENES